MAFPDGFNHFSMPNKEKQVRLYFLPENVVSQRMPKASGKTASWNFKATLGIE